jgi:hypothetical protein
MNILVSSLVGKYCSQRETTAAQKGGDLIRKIILDSWAKEPYFNISFKDVEAITPSFLDEAIGKLALTHNMEELRNKLKFEDYDETLKDKINRSIVLRVKQEQTEKP